MACHLTHRYSQRRRTGAAVAVVFCLLGLLPGCAPGLLAQTAPKPRRKVLQSAAPVYPFVLQNGHFEGQVRLEATVQANGTVSKVETKGGNPMLAQYAVEAVMKWKYAPAPGPTIEEVSFHFNSNSK